MMGYYNGNWGVGDWLVMGAMMLVFWGSVIALVVWVAQSNRSGDQQPSNRGPRTDGPDEILAERFARGDIDEDEFQRRRELMQGTSSTSR